MGEAFASSNRYSSAGMSALEHAAVDWLDGFYQLEHLLCARKWAMELLPSASQELRFAALVHDAERYFPGGPTSTPTNGFDDADYLFAHSKRSADIVEAWLARQHPRPEAGFIRRVRALILRHELGGNFEEDVLQAADSLSFVEVYDWLAIEWVRSGLYPIADVRAKWDWMIERIRISSAVRSALPFYARTMAILDKPNAFAGDLGMLRRAAGCKTGLLENKA